MDLERIMEENQKKIQEQQKKMVSFKLPLLVLCRGSDKEKKAHKNETFPLDGVGGFNEAWKLLMEV
jgi:hypothetical protein